MNPKLRSRLDSVRDALNNAGIGLNPTEWKELLEEISADVDGHLDAVHEEEEEIQRHTRKDSEGK